MAAFCAGAVPGAAQKFIPKSIQFQGDPEYSAQELMDAAGLKTGVALNFADMSGYTQHLLESGVFANAAFKFDGRDLVFSLVPSPDLYPIRLANLPLAPDTDLNRKLHDKFPLYHGKVPADGGLEESVRIELQALLAEQKIEATVTATAAADPITHKVNAVAYSVSSPQVFIGEVKLDGVSPRYAGAVEKAVDEAAKLPFDTENSAGSLRQAVEQVYHDRGYAAVKVKVTRSGAPMAASDGMHVPFSIAVEEGCVYKVAAIHLPDGAPLSQQEIEKVLADRSETSIEGIRIRSVWMLLSERYKAQGHMDCRITPTAHFDEAAGTVSYDVEVNPGPVYHLGFVRFENVSDQMLSLLMRYWQMMPGDVFDESYVSQFIYKAKEQDPVLRRSLEGVKVSFDANADPQALQVNLVIRLSR